MSTIDFGSFFSAVGKEFAAGILRSLDEFTVSFKERLEPILQEPLLGDWRSELADLAERLAADHGIEIEQESMLELERTIELKYERVRRTSTLTAGRRSHSAIDSDGAFV